MPPFAIDVDDVFHAHRAVSPHVHRTPIMTNASLDASTGLSVQMKCEHFQKTGSFKIRGALNAVIHLPKSDAEHGVVTHSSGNHAAALALAARMRGIDAHVVMPVNSAPVKREAARSYGARIYDCEPTQEAREASAERIAAETGGTLIPPFDHPHIMAGQGTLGLELLEQVDSIDAVIVPVGGGGLISGIAIALEALAPDVRIVAAEPEAADDTYRSFSTGKRLLQPPTQTVADGLRTTVGKLTFPIIQHRVEEVITVSEQSIVDHMRWTWERTKLLIEPSAAVGIAALHSPELKSMGFKSVAVILCGGNVDLDRLPWQTVLA